jgi:hypothetical protein
MKKVIAFLLICTSGFSQIKVDDVGTGWKDKVLQAIEVVRTYDIKKYNFLIEHCHHVNFWNGTYSTTELPDRILISAAEVTKGTINDLAAALVHESLHLCFSKNVITISSFKEEELCYKYELDFLMNIPNVEPWLIKHAQQQIINNQR